MQACWSCDPEGRPPFVLVRELLWDMQKSEHPYVNVDPSQEIILPPVDQGEKPFKVYYRLFLLIFW
jgi:hypothetical protein